MESKHTPGPWYWGAFGETIQAELLRELELILANFRTDGASDSYGQVSLSRAREMRIEGLIAKARGQQ